MFEEQNLQCADCGCVFPFTVEEQEFYYQKGFSSPKRCNDCRAARKRQRQGGGGGGGGRRGGGGDRPRYSVICSDCGCETTVPFEPSGDRPVYCSDCYRKQ